MRICDSISEKLSCYCLPAAPPIVVCIGSDRITGDSLGPVTGQLLVSHYNLPAFVYGTLKEPVTALTLRDTIDLIQSKHCGRKIIAVDSCIGAKADIGVINVAAGGLLPGSADGKVLPRIGDVSITAVTSSHAPSTPAFASVRLGFVYKLAKDIADGISLYFSNSYRNRLQTYILTPSQLRDK